MSLSFQRWSDHHHMRSRRLEMTPPILHHCWGSVLYYLIFLFVCFLVLFLLLLEDGEVEAEWLTHLNFSLIEVQQESSSFAI